MKPIFRIIIAIVACAIAAAIIYALTYVGKQTQGPLEDAFTSVSEVVREVEETVIIEKRSEKRSENISPSGRSISELKNPKKFLFGAFDEKSTESLQAVFDLEKKLNTSFALVQIYVAWGHKPDQKFPKVQVEGILKSGSFPVITWEPWLTDFDPTEFQNGLRPVETRDKNGLIDIANGIYDQYIHQWAREAATVGKPIFIRLGHEMNDPYRYPWGPQNNAAADYVTAWKHVHQVFKTENANNVIWVWSPHPAHGWFEAYFPGKDYVDWVGIGALNYGTVANWSKWWNFEDIFGKYYTDLASFGKPIMLCEFGSLSVGGDRKQWYEDALKDLPKKYPKVKGLLFFHFSKDNTTTLQPLDWTIHNDPELLKVIGNHIRKF